jgi:hypothetical protein
VRDGEWHHLAATKRGAAAALYIDGQAVHSSATGAGSQLAIGPWHVMRNGSSQVFSAGEADELALYTRALSAGEIKGHYDLARDLADDPLPANPPADDPRPAPGRVAACWVAACWAPHSQARLPVRGRGPSP